MVLMGALKTPSIEKRWWKNCYLLTKSAHYLPEEDVIFELDEVKNARYSTKRHALKYHMTKQVIKKSWFQCLQLYETKSNFSLINGTAERIDLKNVVVPIQQKTFIQTKAVRSVLKGKMIAARNNVHATLKGITNSVFMTEFDYFLFGLSFYDGWKSLFFGLRKFQLHL